MENITFNYTYSAARKKEVEKIRKKYMPREQSKLDRLKKLDVRAQGAGMIEGLSVGIIGALVFGIGMCFFLDVFAGAAWLSVFFMIIGTLIMIAAYPVYKRIARKTKAELTPEILRLSEELMRN